MNTSSSASRLYSRTVHANGLDFPIVEAGAGPLVLCLHGFPDHAGSWRELLNCLAQEGYWAVAPALRGYWSGGAGLGGSYRAWVTGQDVLALVEALGREQADLVGHGWGAGAAYAAAGLDATRVRKVVGMAQQRSVPQERVGRREAHSSAFRPNGALHMPFLRLQGADGRSGSEQSHDGLDALFVNGYRRIVVPGAGHFLHLEQPRTVAGHIVSFLDS
ncbi:alpha/beta fold hydrolase [Streptomyces sp. 3214.6]|uniref:alpha/beta fold hydrolase n=1 Tax=Streptomyces sp. 3214.6 TaxID=1882757 RepID=UPI001E371A48|nr:alpha/beta hydrolase [Streptomyces sp. 3214.6]